MTLSTSSSPKNLREVSKSEPCPHCQKEDWCYFLGENLSVCKRGNDPGAGWFKTSKQDANGDLYYAIQQNQESFGNFDKQRGKVPQPIKSPAPLPEGDIRLGKLGEGAEASPQRTWEGDRHRLIYNYSENQWVERYEKPDPNSPKGYTKETKPRHRDAEGKRKAGKGDRVWMPYRMEEITQWGKDAWVMVVEGENCVEVARSLGILAFTFQGSDWSKIAITQGLEALKQVGIKGIICYRDNDSPGEKKEKTLEEISAILELPFLAIDPISLWRDTPITGDIVDWVAQHQDMDVEAFIARLEEEIHESVNKRLEREILLSIADERAQAQAEAEAQDAEDNKPQSPRLAKRVQKIRDGWSGIKGWGDRIRLNQLSMQIEFDGEPMDWDTLKVDIAEDLWIEMPQEDAQQAIRKIAKQKIYHPVRDYLKEMAVKYNDQDPGILDNLATMFFGTDKEIYNIYLKKWLVAAVARIFDPGCKVDDSLVLHGLQGALKSTFFSTMAVRPEWFCDSVDLSSSEKETLQVIHSAWIIELGEIENLTTKKDDSWWKNFSARRMDKFRPPYGRVPKEFLRKFVMVGSTNREEFLNDPTGNRRFWIIPLGKNKVNIKLVEEMRDKVWGAAVHEYISQRTTTYLSEEESKLRAEENARFQVDDLWDTEELERWLDCRNITTLAEVATDFLKLDISHQDKKAYFRIADMIRKCGWTKSQKRINGKPQKCWIRPEEPPTPPPDGGNPPVPNPSDGNGGGYGDSYTKEPLPPKDSSTSTSNVSTVSNEDKQLTLSDAPTQSDLTATPQTTPTESPEFNNSMDTPTRENIQSQGTQTDTGRTHALSPDFLDTAKDTGNAKAPQLEDKRDPQVKNLKVGSQITFASLSFDGTRKGRVTEYKTITTETAIYFEYLVVQYWTREGNKTEKIGNPAFIKS